MATAPSSPPSLTTLPATSVTAISAVLNGSLDFAGTIFVSGSNTPATVSERGFVLSTNANPTVSDTKIIAAGTSTGTYSANALNLQPNTVYHYRAYAMNDAGAGVGYGNDVTFSIFLPKHLFPKRYIYKVRSNGQYIGSLPKPTSEFSLPQDINTTGSQITIVVPVSADTASAQSVTTIQDETGATIQDEAGNDLLSEGAPPLVGLGNTVGTLIKNGNEIEVVEYGYYHPNGITMFRGEIERWEADYGGDGGTDAITILVYSDGKDLDDALVRGNPYTFTVDQVQTSQNNRFSLFYQTADTGGGWNFYGQSFVVGGSTATNVGGIELDLDGTANVTVTLYDGAAMANILASVTQPVSVSGPTAVMFGFPSHAIVNGGASLFFTVKVNQGESIWIQYQNSNVYANGSLYSSIFAGGSGGGAWSPDTTKDLYFRTFSSSGSTTATFTNVDPIAGILKPVLNDYIAQGGKTRYTSTSVQNSALLLSYKFNTQTVYEALQAILTISPAAYFYYLDMGTNILYFKQASATPDVVFTKGRHLSTIKIVATIEYMENTAYVTGGTPTGQTSNIYTIDSDGASVSLYGTRLVRKNDSHILDTTSSHAVGKSAVADGKDEKFQSVITIVDNTMDITQLKVGMIAGFNGFGTFVDTLTSQIVRVEYHPDYATLTLGILPHRNDSVVDQLTRSLTASSTITNPTSPS